jgi:hypothetical protein
MLDIANVDLDDIIMALQDQSYEHSWLIDPATGEITFVSEYDGFDGDLDDTDLVRIDPVPSRVWYMDMADFADGITDERAARRLARAIQGRGAFRRFKDELHDEYPHLLTLWYEFSGRRALRRAVAWLAESSLVDSDVADRFLDEHPDIDLRSASPGCVVPPGETSSPWSDTEFDALIENVTAGASPDDDQLAGLRTALEARLDLPFTTEVLGVRVSVDRLDVSEDGRIVAVCVRDGATQAIGILELPLPDPTSLRAQVVAAYRRGAQWRRSR